MTQRTSDFVDISVRFLKGVGIPSGVLLIVLYLVQQAAMALHGDVLVPAVRAHSEFLMSTQETLRTLGRAQEEQVEAHRQQAEALRELARVQKLIFTAVGGKDWTGKESQ